ncbi:MULTISPECIES: nuclear transport factor 2 family protein [Burkholderia cepacia complex]|uniref:nuclear transport factor 2 family protein n=1 Tax=Burkholderia cepacia complex TaxID=87882 RepID=UPI001CF27E4C|nr:MULTISPECIES: nuclear transport factor 2 family protein [Burkholderia cepacia complex]MCA8057360.1 nuclear transport factor 2 family protein [Burkholderia cepacia]MDN7535185.1 nuclear transport factor 2 family protein [Burkholderia orbicola]
MDIQQQQDIDSLVNQPHFTPEQKHKAKLVMDVYRYVFLEKGQFERATPLFADRYIQHNPRLPDGIAGLRPWAEGEAARGAQVKFYRLMVDQDLVFVHACVYRWPGDRGMAVADLFRLENGRLAEHWDVWQDVPEDCANANTMF